MESSKSIVLYEYTDSTVPLKDLEQRGRLESYLKEIWSKRYCAYAKELDEDTEPAEEERRQPFLRFDGNHFRAQNFVGFIQFEDLLIEIYPKVFRDWDSGKKELMLKHLFFWFSYCRRIHFPVLETNLDKLSSDTIPELLIWNFADYCQKIISEQPFSRYELQEEALQSPRGRIDFSAYIRNGLTSGNHHQIDCVYESFEFDNKLNRAIKYVCRLLITISRMNETRDKLGEIIFILDDVTDEVCSATELDSVILNPIFASYQPIKEWCQRFLEQQLYSDSAYNSMQWSLLLPMEYVFEDFTAGFLKTHFSDHFKIETQRSDLYLTTNHTFQLRHDILLRKINSKVQIIIDTKYKIRSHSDSSDPKKGVAQTDLYQMLAYAYRRGSKKIYLIYPNASEVLKADSSIQIESGFNPTELIDVHVCEIPFWEKSVANLKLILINRFGNLFGIE